MDGFSYTDIFDTKGVEYLIIITFLLLIIPVWYFFSRPVSVRAGAREAGRILSARILRIPGGVFFSRYHTWAFLEPSGMAKIGADDLLLHLTGDVHLENLCSTGDRITKGQPIARIVKDGKSLEIASPLSGEITGLNGSLSGLEGLINDDPYGKGWILRIKPGKWQAETGSCYLAADALTWLNNELVRVQGIYPRQGPCGYATFGGIAGRRRTDRSSAGIHAGGDLEGISVQVPGMTRIMDFDPARPFEIVGNCLILTALKGGMRARR